VHALSALRRELGKVPAACAPAWPMTRAKRWRATIETFQGFEDEVYSVTRIRQATSIERDMNGLVRHICPRDATAILTREGSWLLKGRKPTRVALSQAFAIALESFCGVRSTVASLGQDMATRPFHVSRSMDVAMADAVTEVHLHLQKPWKVHRGAPSLCPGHRPVVRMAAGTLPSSRLKPISAARGRAIFILNRIVKRLLRSINVPIASIASPFDQIALPNLLGFSTHTSAGFMDRDHPIMPRVCPSAAQGQSLTVMLTQKLTSSLRISPRCKHVDRSIDRSREKPSANEALLPARRHAVGGACRKSAEVTSRADMREYPGPATPNLPQLNQATRRRHRRAYPAMQASFPRLLAIA